MSNEAPKPPTLLERASAEAAKAAVVSGLEAAATGALDAVERLLFGKVGGAEEAVRREESADPLERLRAQYGSAEPQSAAATPKNTAPKEDPNEVAIRQLADLKRARAERLAAAEAGEIKKTL